MLPNPAVASSAPARWPSRSPNTFCVSLISPMKSALLLIDLQQDFLIPQDPHSFADLQPPAAVLVPRAAELLRACRERKIPVIHVWTTVERKKDIRLPHWRAQNRWMCVAGTPGHETPEPLRPLAGESI